MQLLEFPLEVFRLIIQIVVRDQRCQSMKSRVVCRAFANEILDAVITTRVIDDVVECSKSLKLLGPHFDVIARYLHHRVRTDGLDDSHPWILTIRETSERLAIHMASLEKPMKLDRIESSVCLCLAVNMSDWVFRGLFRTRAPLYPKDHMQGGTWENCLSVAAWMGDFKLVHSLLDDNASVSGANTSSDPPSFFGRPSWAAAVNGNTDLWKFFWERGALPFEPTYRWNRRLVLGESPLGAAAYMGHDSIVRLILQTAHHHPELKREEAKAAKHAAYANRPQTLRTLLEHCKHTHTKTELLKLLNVSLVFGSCQRGAPDTTRVLLEYGAKPNATNDKPRSCLQIAADSGNAMTVAALLDAGAALVPAEYRQRFRANETDSDSRKLTLQRLGRRIALKIANRMYHPDIVQLIREKIREIEQNEGVTWKGTRRQKKEVLN